jgi:hypothetical protein
MKNLIKTYEMLIKTCEEEIELNGTRSINYESWLKGKKKSYEKILKTINEVETKEQLTGEIEMRIILSNISLEECVKEDDTEARISYLRGLIDGYKESLPRIENYI